MRFIKDIKPSLEEVEDGYVNNCWKLQERIPVIINGDFPASTFLIMCEEYKKQADYMSRKRM